MTRQTSSDLCLESSIHVCVGQAAEYLEEGYMVKNDKAEFEGIEGESCGSLTTGMKHTAF